jgi:hypothetical protein
VNNLKTGLFKILTNSNLPSRRIIVGKKAVYRRLKKILIPTRTRNKEKI